jgi:excisionase family DNA binding protein
MDDCDADGAVSWGTGLVRIGEAARFLAVSARHLQALTKAGSMPSVRVGRRGVRYARKDLVEFVTRHRQVREVHT